MSSAVEEALDDWALAVRVLQTHTSALASVSAERDVAVRHHVDKARQALQTMVSVADYLARVSEASK